MSTLSSRQVISVSRRTDIAAFYSDWFIDRVREGFVRYRNPFGGKMCEVSLTSEDVMAFVFWSRNYAPLLKYLPELDDLGYGGYFHLTLTDYGPSLEPFAPASQKIVEVFHTLAARYSPKHVLWRFDPIILSNKTPEVDIVHKFTSLARQLCGTIERCYISFVDFYRKVGRNLESLSKQGFQFYDPGLEEKGALTQQLVEIGNRYGIRLYACCEEEILQIPGIQQAHCVDPLLLHELFPQKFHPLKSTPTRKGCGCFASRDIGAYETCIHGCLYCYANSNHEKTLERFKAHDVSSASL